MSGSQKANEYETYSSERMIARLLYGTLVVPTTISSLEQTVWRWSILSVYLDIIRYAPLEFRYITLCVKCKVNVSSPCKRTIFLN